jgi:hypothetical protein
MSGSAVLFSESSGYLFVGVVGQGGEGAACLLHSLADGQLYLRKTSRSTNEVSVYRQRSRIPKLIAWQDYPESTSVAIFQQ